VVLAAIAGSAAIAACDGRCSAKGGDDDYTTEDGESARQCEGERCVLLMAEMVTAPPSTATANGKTSKDFFITALPRFDPRDLAAARI
jgi:hypothetical protein